MFKYMKYELKGTYKFVLGVALLIVAFIMAIYFYTQNVTPNNLIVGNLMGILTLAAFGIMLTTFLYIVNSFRKELYENRGYLTFTLPLSGQQILGAKLVVALGWFMVIWVAIMGSIFFLGVINPQIDMVQIFSFIQARHVISTFALMAFNGIHILILIYFSMALGKVTFKNKKIGGLWFVIFLLLNGLSTYATVKVAQFFPYYMKVGNIGGAHVVGIEQISFAVQGSGMITGDTYGNILINYPSLLFLFGMIAFMFWATGYLLEHKINL